MLEIYVPITNLNMLLEGKSINAKLNYQGQTDCRLLINPKKYVIRYNPSIGNQTLILIRKKKIYERFNIFPGK